MKKILSLRKSYKVGLLTAFVSLLAFCATAFLIPTRIDIPLGIICSGVLFSLLNFFQGLAEKHDTEKAGTTFSLVVIILKFVVIVAFILIAALMYYRWNVPYLNVFTIVGVYTANLIATLLVYILDKE